ncbi:MAG: chloride channel protein, partial [Chthoniobacteraceae bacterium]
MTSSLPHRHSVFFLCGASMVLAVISTVIAWALVLLIELITSIAFHQRFSTEFSSPVGHNLGLGVIFVPVIGGLIIGLMARYGSKAIRGHGIPEAMEQILLNRSRIPARITILKPLSAAISIGTGGPFGAEGPIIATGGALGSLIGQIFTVTASERKVLLAAGAAAGMTAIFGTPVAAVLLAIELLLFEFGARSTVPVALACATAAAVRVWFFGSEPVFAMAAAPVPTPSALFAFVVLGGLIGVAAAVISRAVYWVEDQFERLPVHWMWWPAIGAIGVGIIGYFAPRTLGVGYVNIEAILSNALPLSFVAWLCGMKLLSWLISLGSGTSGGTLAPLLTIGSGLGALLAAGFGWAVPGLEMHLGLAALVGMAAMFAGASRALLASVVFAFETTLQPHTLPALLGGATAAYLVSTLLQRHSIMTERIARRGISVPHTYESDPLQHTQVGEVMETDLQTIPSSMTLEELAARIGANDPLVARRQASLVVDDHHALVGIITRGDVVKAVETLPGDRSVLEVASRNFVVTFPDETLHQALARMLEHGIGRLRVVERTNPTVAVGYLGRAHFLAAKLLQLEEGNRREPGWLD